MMRWLQRLNQHSARSQRGYVDSEQRGQGHGEIDRLGVGAVGSRLKRESIESERHMSIVRERRLVIGTLRDSNVKRRGDSDHIPPALGRITVSVAAPDFGGRNVSARQLRLSEV